MDSDEVRQRHKDIGQCDKSKKEIQTKGAPTKKMWTKKSLPEPSRLPKKKGPTADAQWLQQTMRSPCSELRLLFAMPSCRGPTAIGLIRKKTCNYRPARTTGGPLGAKIGGPRTRETQRYHILTYLDIMAATLVVLDQGPRYARVILRLSTGSLSPFAAMKPGRMLCG